MQEQNSLIAACNERTRWFLSDRFGMFIHWGLYSIPARGEWVRSVERISNEAYQPYFDEFHPDNFDPKGWVSLAKQAGMKYAVLTAKHHDGFCLFDSQLTDYKSSNTPCQRDLVREYVEAFRAEGLKVGLYYSLLDWHHRIIRRTATATTRCGITMFIKTAGRIFPAISNTCTGRSGNC
jgi:alpha-L-fucosidase